MFRVIACSQRVGKLQRAKKNNNNREPGLSAERQGSFSGWRAATHQGHAAVIPWEEMLEIPNSGDGPRHSRYERGGSQFFPALHVGCFCGGGVWRWLAGAGSVD